MKTINPVLFRQSTRLPKKNRSKNYPKKHIFFCCVRKIASTVIYELAKNITIKLVYIRIKLVDSCINYSHIRKSQLSKRIQITMEKHFERRWSLGHRLKQTHKKPYLYRLIAFKFMNRENNEIVWIFRSIVAKKLTKNKLSLVTCKSLHLLKTKKKNIPIEGRKSWNK